MTVGYGTAEAAPLQSVKSSWIIQVQRRVRRDFFPCPSADLKRRWRSLCRPYGTRGPFPILPSTPPAAPCWA